MPKPKAFSQHELRQRAVQVLFSLEIAEQIQADADRALLLQKNQIEKLQHRLDKKKHFLKEDDWAAGIEVRDLEREVNSLRSQYDEAKDFQMNTDLEALKHFVINYDMTDKEKESAEERELPAFFLTLVDGVLENQALLDASISEHLAKNWSLSRLTNVERAILRLGAYELLFSDLAPNISINEAIELAKDFSDETSSKFINGLLTNLIVK